MKRKISSLVLVVMMLVMTVAGCGNNSASSSGSTVETAADKQGKVLNIYCWNTEFQEIGRASCRERV